MNCNVHKLNLCFLKQETPNNPTFKFDTDISNDSFTYTVKNYNIGQTVVYGIGSGITIVDNHTIEIEIPIDQMVIGSYSHELLWETADGTKRVVFQGLLKISETGEYCADCQTNIGEYTVNIVNDEIVVNVVLGSGGGGNSINDIEIIPYVYAQDTNIKKSYYFYEGIDSFTIIPTSVEEYLLINNYIQSRIKKLNLKFKNFDLIANDNPILLVERYRHSRRQNRAAAGAIGNHKSQFIAPHNRVSQMPITSENLLDIDFKQETYFAPASTSLGNEHDRFRSRGSNRGIKKQHFQIFQFRVKTDKGISKPLLKIKLIANIDSKQRHNMPPFGNMFFPNDDTPQYDLFLNVGYKEI